MILDNWKINNLYCLVNAFTLTPCYGFCVPDKITYSLIILNIFGPFRKKGYGRWIVEHLIHKREKSFSELMEILAVDDSIPFWEKMGFIIPQPEDLLTYKNCHKMIFNKQNFLTNYSPNKLALRVYRDCL